MDKDIEIISKKLASSKPTAALFLKRAKLYEELGEFDKALADLRNAAVLEDSLPRSSSSSSHFASAEIQRLLIRVAEKRLKDAEDSSLEGLLNAACPGSEYSDVDSSQIDAAKKLVFLTFSDEGVSRRIVANPKCISKLVARLRNLLVERPESMDKGLEGAEKAVVMELVSCLSNVANIKDNSYTVLSQLLDDHGSLLVNKMVPLDDIILATKSLEVLTLAVHHSGHGFDSPEIKPIRDLLEDCLKFGVKDELRLLAMNNLIRTAGNDSSCLSLVEGTIYTLILQLCGDQNEKIRSLAALLLCRLYEPLHGNSEEKAKLITRDRVTSWLSSTPQDKTLSLQVLSAVFNARSTFGAAILLHDGVMEELMDIIEYESTLIQVATAEVLSSSCSDQECRKKVASRCSAFLMVASKSSDENLKTVASGALIKLMFADKDLEAKMMADDSLARTFIATLKNEGVHVAATRLHAVEALAYLSLRGVVKELIAGDSQLLKQLVSLAKEEDRTLRYGLVSIFRNLSTMRRKLSEEEEQLVKLKEAAGEGAIKLDPLDNDARVEKRASKLIAAGVVTALCAIAPAVTTLGLAEAVAQVFVNLAIDKRNRGRMVQEGAVKALIQLTTEIKKPADEVPIGSLGAKSPTSSSASTMAAHALAKIAITTDPSIAFKGQRAAELVRPLVALCNGQVPLQQFESLMALTNLASYDESVRTRIVAAKGVKAMEYLQFSDNEMIRRAATEALCNMMYDPSVFESYAKSSSSGRLRMMIALCDVEDFETRRAASGCLAILSSDSNACKLIVEESRGLEVLLGTIYGEENQEILHRGVECVKNIAQLGGTMAQQLAAAGAVQALRLLVRNPHQEVAVAAIEALQHLRKAGITVTAE